MTTPTTNYSWGKPVIGADANTWGTESNAIYDAIDSVMFGKVGAASPTFTGNTIFSGSNAVFSVDGPASTFRNFQFGTSGVVRWRFGMDGAPEAGGNAGSVLTLYRYSDAGALLDTPLTVNRATGLVTLADGLTVAGTITGSLTGNMTGNVTGNVTGSSGSCTGNAATATNATNATTATNATNSTTQAPGTNNLTIATTAFVAAATPAAPATATTTVNGLTTLATGAQVVAGTDTTHAVTPASLTSQQSLAANGYYTLPGGAIEQWGVSGSISNNGSGSVTFPLSFPSALYSIVITPTGSAGTGGMAYAYTFAQGVSGFSIFNAGGNAISFYWRAVGK